MTDHAAAQELFHAAAKQGHLLAMRAIGMAYERGSGGSYDAVAALSWYRRAADYGDDRSTQL